MFPRLIASGELGDLDPFLIAAERKVVVKLGKTSNPMAVALLLEIFYVFNIEYIPGVRNLFAFLEHIMLGLSDTPQKRISVQFLYEFLNNYCTYGPYNLKSSKVLLANLLRW